ncbi:MAG: esterase, depolymerase family [Gemmatimonadetes bacterium]|nr:esterase, depolymerase family [Gemmatimonadota bacterium]
MIRPSAAVLVLASLLAAACADAPTAIDRAAPVRGPAKVTASAAGGWVYGSYTNAYGSRAYQLWVPAGYTGATAVPLMVMMHGCQQTPADFAAGTRMNQIADARGFLVLYPQQSVFANASSCWNWFYIANQVRGSGEPSIIAGMIDAVKAGYDVDAARVGAAGISAGAAMSTVLACTYPDKVRKVASSAGLMYGAATTSIGGVNAMTYGSIYDPTAEGTDCYNRMGSNRRTIPVLVFQGTADPYVNPLNATQTVGQWTQTADLTTDGADNGNVDATADATVSGTACRAYTQSDYRSSTTGATVVRKYLVSGLGHAWSGGSTAGPYSDPCGPDASTLIANFFGF